ncbi:efflux transporter [Colletotrichum truncatum]|uniref:Efflux transporter n=1 Tax=Colletotrichum truncatum TaxID=5467 RepID=A0ACC3YF53_COLTU
MNKLLIQALVIILRTIGHDLGIPESILGTTFPPGKAKNSTFSIYIAGAPLGSIFRNLITGFITQYTGWKWLFIVITSRAGAMVVAGFFVIPPPPSPPELPIRARSTHSKPSVDWIGGLLVTVSLLALLLALTDGNIVGLATLWIPMLIVVLIVILTGFVFLVVPP